MNTTSVWQVSWQYNIDLPCGPAVRKVCPAKCEDGPRQFGDDEQHRADTVLHSNMELGLQWSWWTWDLKIIFHATSFSLDIHSNGLKMEIVFKRRLTNELLTTFLPSFLLLLMSYATSFFKPIYFEAAVTVNLSILLVTTTLFIRQGRKSTPFIIGMALKWYNFSSVMGKLPATSYVRLVDIWLIFGQMYPFLQEYSLLQNFYFYLKGMIIF